jgi:pimeloyl-ACP methyl ester carboxylesterase
MSERDVVLRDGRTLHIWDEGDPDGSPVVAHHGTPGGGLPYPLDVEKARAHGLRWISYDRAGYGGSTPSPGRNVAAVADDIADVLDALEVDRFASIGGSGGGPHSLALGALLADRCVGACAIACPTPWEAEGIDWLEGQGEQNLAEWAAAVEGPDVLQAHLEPFARELLETTPEQMRDVLDTLLPPVDRAVLTGDRAEHAHRSDELSLAPGVAGWRDDDLAFIRPWGFELSQIRVPVLLWQGVQDKMVPAAHGRWLAERIPGVDAHISEEDGHLSIVVTRLPEILQWLRDRF